MFVDASLCCMFAQKVTLKREELNTFHIEMYHCNVPFSQFETRTAQYTEENLLLMHFCVSSTCIDDGLDCVKSKVFYVLSAMHSCFACQ